MFLMFLKFEHRHCVSFLPLFLRRCLTQVTSSFLLVPLVALTTNFLNFGFSFFSYFLVSIYLCASAAPIDIKVTVLFHFSYQFDLDRLAQLSHRFPIVIQVYLPRHPT
ncbi:hypothetical protein F4774DRAFT_154843 [Daldinia eschscholtzii]|nr:hypothetical protein F4774DRAFT_154843 [Daldinia eschscholtzii]